MKGKEINISNCLKIVLFLFLIHSSNIGIAQYCTSNLQGSNCIENNQITGVEIVGTTLVNNNNGCIDTPGGTYTNYPDSANTTATLNMGQTYILKVISSANSIISVWIDYNHNFAFATNEWKQVCTTSVAGVAKQVSITIPQVTYSGSTIMRIRSTNQGQQNGPSYPCFPFGYGETEDYTITLQNPPCVSPPIAGSAIATLPVLCTGKPDTLKLIGYTYGAGQSYQWQFSPDSLNWADIVGATNTVFFDTMITSAYYRCILTCSLLSDTSNSVFVRVKPSNQCYCSQTVNYTSGADIGYVRFASLNNGTDTTLFSNSNSNKTYSDFTNLPPVDLVPSATYAMRVNQISSNSSGSISVIYVFIDYDQNGIFNTTNERIQLGTILSPSSAVVNGLINIPDSALTGVTGMRIILREGTPVAPSPCSAYDHGETEDYLVNILPAVGCISPPLGGVAIASANEICVGTKVNFNLINNSTGTNQTYRWQFSADSLLWTDLIGATNPYFTDTILNEGYFRCTVICNLDSVASLPVKVSFKPPSLCPYCNSTAIYTDGSDIGYVSIANLQNGSDTTARNNSTAIKTYTNFTALPATDLSRGSSHIMTIKQIYQTQAFVYSYVKVFIDFNQDNFFNSTDEVFDFGQTNSGPGGNVLNNVISIPMNALPGNTRMRIVMRQFGTAVLSACGNYNYGETEDYTINITPYIIPCVFPPTGGVTIASDSMVCFGSEVFFTLQGNSSGAGQIYQWQSSTDSLLWITFPSAISDTLTDYITASKYYRCSIICNGQMATSKPVLVVIDTVNNCYCNSTASSLLYLDIGHVSISTLSNGVDTTLFNNTSAYNSYTDFTNLTPTNLIQGQNYPIRIIQINNNSNLFQGYVTVHIDFNNNGIFESPNEVFPIGLTTTANSGKLSGNIIIPYVSDTGNVRMRIILRAGGSALQNPCGTFYFGETEDYTVKIVSGNPCTSPPNAGITIAVDSSLCDGSLTSLHLQGNSEGFGQTYQWQNSTDSLNWLNIQGAEYPFFSTPFTIPQYYRCIVSCSTISSTSSVVYINDQVSNLCYCDTTLGGSACGSVSSRNYISNVTIAGTTLNNSSTICTVTNGSTLNSFLPYNNLTATLLTGNSYNLSVTTNYNDVISLWIDYNQNGIFETNEWKQVATSSVAGIPNTVNLVIPTGIPAGQTGMRIRSREQGTGAIPATSACGNFSTGETEDYIITIDIGNSNPDNQIENLDFQLSPNPAKETISISFLNKERSKLQIEITDLKGQKVYSEELAGAVGRIQKTIDINKFSKGFYLFRLVSLTEVFTRKLIVE